jgi:hypothetical protein
MWNNNVESFDVSLQEKFVHPFLEEVPVMPIDTANVSVNRISIRLGKSMLKGNMQ